MNTTIRTTLTALVLAPLAACGPADEADTPAEDASAEVEATVPATPVAIDRQPDTTAAGVMAMLEEVDYRSTYELWPEKGELYTGQEPHGMLLTTYLNEPAIRALVAGDSMMPAGAVLVKENFTPDSALAAVTVMVKNRIAYNPEHNNWFFLKYQADGTVEASGRVEGCQSCHMEQAENDYIFTGQLGEM